jgi:hypothetical protein
VAKRKIDRTGAPAELLQAFVQRGVDLAKTARRNRKSLTGDNFYANKLVELRADATNAFRQLTSRSAGDTSALAELIEAVFAPTTRSKDRAAAARELTYALKTTWSNQPKHAVDEEEGLFPLLILSQANRGYLVSVGRQMNGCFSAGWYDASAVMMRRLLEIALIEAFEANGIARKITDGAGNYFQLSELITAALSESSWHLSRNTRKFLPTLRDVGHMSAHGRYFNAKKPDLEAIRQGCRVVVEEFLHHARLL